MSDFYCRTQGHLTKYKGTDAHVRIPEDITVIERDAFSDCNFVEAIDFNNVKVIGPYAFDELENLHTVQFGNTLETIGEYAFHYTGLRCVTIPGSVHTIPSYAFGSCLNLKEVFIEEGCRRIESGAFYCIDDKPTLHMHLPTSVTWIEDEYAFKNRCPSAKSLVIYSGLSDYILNFCRRYYYDLDLRWSYEPGEYDIQAQIANYNSKTDDLKREKKLLEKAMAELDALKTEQARTKVRLNTLKGLFKIKERKECERTFYGLSYQIEEKNKKVETRKTTCARLEEKINEWNQLSYEEKRSTVIHRLMKKAPAYQKEFDASDKHVTVFVSDIVTRMQANSEPEKPNEPDFIIVPRIDVSDM